jgi:hypothetical protein
MNRVGLHHRDGPSAWAVIGAPLVGVPLLVMLLAVTAPADPAPEFDPEGAIRTEAVEVLPADVELNADEAALDSVVREG